jgi:hypothetical protein
MHFVPKSSGLVTAVYTLVAVSILKKELAAQA